jgi:hypothetical protein
MINDILHFKKKFYILANSLQRKLFKQNYNDFHTKHFEYEKFSSYFKENIDNRTC